LLDKFPLSRLFRRSAARSPRSSDAELETSLRQILDQARAAWPTADVSDETFVAYLGERFNGDLAQLRTRDLYLACACNQGSPVAINLFRTHYLRDLRSALARLRPSREFLAEVRQDLIQKLFVPDSKGRLKISDYSGRAALGTWIHTAALRTALNLRRQAHPRALVDRDGLIEETSLFSLGELEFARFHHRDDFKAAIAAAIGRLSPRDRNLLRMHHLGGMTLDQLATIYRAHRVSVARWLAASRAAILEETQRTISKKLKLSRSQLMSLQRVMRSHLDVSLYRLLSDVTDPRTDEHVKS
jgi:RNA polymerase sigma-70 factor (ECF subfamily)